MFVPEDLTDEKFITIQPHQTLSIPLGIATALPKGYGAIITDRSSMAKRSLKVMGGEIDNGYRGEWHVLIHNLSDEPQKIELGSRIAQFRLMPIFSAEFVEVDTLPASKRGNKGFGSTGSK